MKMIKLHDAKSGKNSDLCLIKEYSFGDKDIDLGVATITGRYPSGSIVQIWNAKN